MTHFNFLYPKDISEMHVGYGKSEPADEKLSLKRAWSLSRDVTFGK